MKSAVDSSALFAILRGESTADHWLDIMITQAAKGELVICDIVAAEISIAFDNYATLKKLSLRLDPLTTETSFIAGEIYRAYRKHGGKRERIIPDFIVGAHALKQCDVLIAADRGFYREYFRGVTVLGVD